MSLTPQEILDKIPESEVWRIEIPTIPEKANYQGPPQAKILKRTGDFSWDCLGYLMLSANPECASALKALAMLANEALLIRKHTEMQSRPTTREGA